jgi:hypothetical protein
LCPGPPSSPGKVADKDTAHEVRGALRTRLVDKLSEKGLDKVHGDRVTHGHRRFARVARPRGDVRGDAPVVHYGHV